MSEITKEIHDLVQPDVSDETFLLQRGERRAQRDDRLDKQTAKFTENRSQSSPGSRLYLNGFHEEHDDDHDRHERERVAGHPRQHDIHRQLLDRLQSDIPRASREQAFVVLLRQQI